MDRDKLKEILLAHKSYISKVVKNLISKGIDPSKLTYKETDKITDEFIDTIINKIPIDIVLNKIDEYLAKIIEE
jgi:predicted transcriptional regulator